MLSRVGRHTVTGRSAIPNRTLTIRWSDISLLPITLLSFLRVVAIELVKILVALCSASETLLPRYRTELELREHAPDPSCGSGHPKLINARITYRHPRGGDGNAMPLI